jgi:DNA-binding MarR family transcriptional regulator
MITDLMTILHEIGNTLYRFFVLPGEFILSWLSELAPAAAVQLNGSSDNQAALTLVVLSLLSWSLLAFTVAKLWLLLQNLLRIISAASKTLFFRISLPYGILKKRLLHRLRRLIPQRTAGAIAAPDVDFDDLDLAVLHSAAARGPGFTTSAPELAERLTYRPTQIQRSLNKLSEKKLLDGVIGSTDGFDNYRLSQSGSYLVATLRRNEGNA